MATIFKPQYAVAATITITLNSLASAAARQSLVVDNTTNLYRDVLISLTVESAAGSLGTNPRVDLWSYLLGDGAAYTDSATGADAAFTMPTTPNLVYLGSINVNTAAVAAVSKPYSLLAAVGGAEMPSKWGIVCVNNTGLGLHASLGGTASYIGVNTQGV